MFEPYRVVTRIKGHIGSWEGGQPAGNWSPIFRSRLLHDGDKVFVSPMSEATVGLADGTLLHLHGPGEFAMDLCKLDEVGRQVVFNRRFGKVQEDILRMLGKQVRFEVKQGGVAIAARG